MPKAKTLILWLVALTLFIGIPIVVNRFTGFSEAPVLRAVGALLGGIVLYPLASATAREHKNRQLRFVEYFALVFGIAVFAMCAEGLLAR